MDKHIYIKRNAPKTYIELSLPLDPKSYSNLGTTWQDFLDNKWVLLDSELVKFHEDNPDASVKEVWNKALEPKREKTLLEYKLAKINEIRSYDSSSAINSFTVNGASAWLNNNERTSYTASINNAEILGELTIDMWLNDKIITLPTDLAKKMLAQLSRYADKCYLTTKQHIANVNALTNTEDVESYDYKIDYPNKLAFTL